MNERGFDSLIQAFLAEGRNELPERRYTAVRNEIERTRQRVVIGAWRFPKMNRFAFVIAGAAVVVIASLAAAYWLPRNNSSIGVPGATPSSAVTPTMPATPSATVTPAPTASPQLLEDIFVPPLQPGAYAFGDPFPVQVTLTFPDVWEIHGLEQGDVEFWRAPADSGSIANSISFVQASAVYPDPCHTDGGPDTVGPDVDAVVAALTAQQGFEAGPVQDVTLIGAVGKTFTLHNSIDTDSADCKGGPMLWQFAYPTEFGQALWGTNGGTSERIWVLDADGHVFVAVVMSWAETSDAQSAAAEQVVDTATFR
jgi:hypothetical protein